MGRVEEDYEDVLQNIEVAIIGVYRADPSLLDAHVDAALDGLLRVYQAEARGRSAPNLHLSAPARAVFTAVQTMCGWRLGRETLVSEAGVEITPEPLLSLDVIMACLKRVRRSVALWTREHGRQGYLNFVAQLII